MRDLSMAKSKKENKKKEEDFDINKELETVNPFLVDGFKRFILNKEITSKKQFEKYLKDYGG